MRGLASEAVGSPTGPRNRPEPASYRPCKVFDSSMLLVFPTTTRLCQGFDDIVGVDFFLSWMCVVAIVSWSAARITVASRASKRLVVHIQKPRMLGKNTS